MTGCPEASGQSWLDSGNAPVQVVQLAAIVALEVMVMRFAGDLVSRGIARHFDGLQPSFLNQRLDVPVNGGNAEGGVKPLRGFQRLFRGQRPASLAEGGANGRLLPRLPFIGDHELPFS